MAAGALLALALAAFSPGGDAGAAAPVPARSWTLESFEAEIRVRRDAVVEVTERLEARFRGSFNGIYRLIPEDYRTPAGFEYDLKLEVLQVTDAQGRDLRYEESREGRYRKVKIWIPGAEDALRTVVLRYRTPNGLRFFDDYDELYWNVTGTEWPVPIGRASARVVLPEGVSGVRVQGFTGPYGSRERGAQITVDGNRVQFRVPQGLDFREGLTASVAWDPGVVRRPGFWRRAGWFLGANWPLSLPLLAAGVMLPLWYSRGRDPRVGTVSTRYEPPADLSPGEVGVLIDQSPDMRDITATLVDLAVRGFVRIREEEEEKLLGLLSDRDYVFELVRSREQWSELLPHERELLDALFGGSTRSARLSDLENEFYEELPDLRDRMMGTLVDHGFYSRRPDRVKRLWIVVAVVVAALIVVPGVGSGLGAGLSRLAVVIGGALTGLVVAGVGWLMPVRSMAGTRALGQLLGFEEFLQRVESDRYRRMITGPEMFEEYLPYAMALGVEKKWAKAFQEMYRDPPDWYVAGHGSGFRSTVLVNDLNRFSTSAAAAMTSSPRSSGGSGFSGGGGVSGGGFGGGGGGAF